MSTHGLDPAFDDAVRKVAEACEAKIRPMPNDTEIRCGLTGDHARHEGVLKDYAYPGSATTIIWDEDDRRNFRGAWSRCWDRDANCILPHGHLGRCAQ